MGNVCGSQSIKHADSGQATTATVVRASSDKLQPSESAHTLAGSAKDRDAFTAAADASQSGNSGCHSIQAIKGSSPSAISIKVAPAPPPDEYPEIRAAVAAAQKEVKLGAKLKIDQHYRLGQVIGTGHYARVQLAMSLKDGKKYAVKIIKKNEGKDALLLQLQGESICPIQHHTSCTHASCTMLCINNNSGVEYVWGQVAVIFITAPVSTATRGLIHQAAPNSHFPS